MITPSLRALGLSFSCALVLAAAGCSVDLQNVFTGDGGRPNAGGDGGQTSQGGGGSGGTSGGSGGDTTSMGQGGSSGSTTTAMTTTTTSTTSTTTTTTMMPSDPIDCGNDACQASGEICCWDKWGIGTGNFETGQCLDTPLEPGQCNTNVEQGGVQTIISCQTAADCANGSLCCGDVVQFQGGGQTLSYYPEVECRPDCQWPTRIMCNPAAPDCPDNLNCTQSQLLPEGFYVCSMN